jgi:hypothetical protein
MEPDHVLIYKDFFEVSNFFLFADNDAYNFFVLSKIISYTEAILTPFVVTTHNKIFLGIQYMIRFHVLDLWSFSVNKNFCFKKISYFKKIGHSVVTAKGVKMASVPVYPHYLSALLKENPLKMSEFFKYSKSTISQNKMKFNLVRQKLI